MMNAIVTVKVPVVVFVIAIATAVEIIKIGANLRPLAEAHMYVFFYLKILIYSTVAQERRVQSCGRAIV